MASNNNNVFAGGTAVAKPAKQKKGNANVTRNIGNNNISGALKGLGMSGKNVPTSTKSPKKGTKLSNLFKQSTGKEGKKYLQNSNSNSIETNSNNNSNKKGDNIYNLISRYQKYQNTNSNNNARGTNSNSNARGTNSNSNVRGTQSKNNTGFSSRENTPNIPKRNNKPPNNKPTRKTQTKRPANEPLPQKIYPKRTKLTNEEKIKRQENRTKKMIFEQLKKYRMEKDKLTNNDFNKIINKIYNEHKNVGGINENGRYSRYRFYRNLLYRLQKIYPQMPVEYRNKVKNYIFSSNIKYEGNGSKFVKNVDKYVKNIVINEMKNIIMGNYRYGKRNFNNQISKLAMRYSENGNSNTNENKNLRLIITNALQNIFMSSVNENKRPKAIKELLEYLEPSELYTLLESVSKKDFSLLMTYLKDKFKIQKNITNQNAFKFILSKVLNVSINQLNKNIAGRKLETSGFTKLHPTTYKKYKESNKIRKSIKEIKEKQKNMSSNERRLSNIKLLTLRKKLNNLSGYSNITKRRDVVNIKLQGKNDDVIFTTFIQKIYMDMVHDNTLPGKNLDEKYTYFVKNIIPTIFDTNIKNIMSKTYTKPYNPPRDKKGKVVREITLPYNKNNVEKLAKEEIQSYLNLKTNTLGHTSRIKLRKKVMDPMNFTNINSPMKVVIDSDNDNILEDLIKKSKNLKSTKVLASIYDPGDSLTSFALYPRCKKAMNKKRSSICITNNDMEIDFSPLFFILNYQINDSYAHTQISVGTDVKEKIKLMIRDKSITNMPTASAAAKSETPLDKVSKFLGDFMQILYVIRNNKAGIATCFATIDKSAANMYVYLSKILKVNSPLMFLEYTGNQFSQDSGYYVWFYKMKKYVNAQSNNIMFNSPPSTIQSLPSNSPASARPDVKRLRRTSLKPENFLTPNVQKRVQERRSTTSGASRTLHFGNTPPIRKKSRFS